MSAHKHYTVAAVPAGEAKDIGTAIVAMLASAGVLVPAAWLGSMMGRDIISWLDNAIDTVRDSITYLRFGAEMDELERIIETLQAAGIQVPAQVRAIVDNPITGDAGSGPALNLEYARGWLETTLRLLQEAQDRAESMPDEQRSDQEPREEKGAGEHKASPFLSEDEARMWLQVVSIGRGRNRGDDPEGIMDQLEQVIDQFPSLSDQADELLQEMQRRFKSHEHPIAVKSAGAHTLYR